MSGPAICGKVTVKIGGGATARQLGYDEDCLQLPEDCLMETP